jgi:hypothetical protein
MNKFVKTAAASLLALSAAAPVFAAADAVDISSVTCAEYNAMGETERDQLATLAVQEISGMTDGSLIAENGGVRGDEGVSASPAQESAAESSVASSDGASEGTSTVEAGDDDAAFAEKVRVLNLTCERSDTATLIEAAAGNTTTR